VSSCWVPASICERRTQHNDMITAGVLAQHSVQCTSVPQVLPPPKSPHRYIHRHRHTVFYCFTAAGLKLWNSLPAELRQADISFERFKRLVKTCLFGCWDRGALWLTVKVVPDKFPYLLTTITQPVFITLTQWQLSSLRDVTVRPHGLGLSATHCRLARRISRLIHFSDQFLH